MKVSLPEPSLWQRTIFALTHLLILIWRIIRLPEVRLQTCRSMAAMQFKQFLKDYYVLEQQEDPLEYCSINIPVPLGIGLPFLPCDLPNEFHLFESTLDFSEKGPKVLEFQEDIPTVNRILLPPSHRNFQIQAVDACGHRPFSAMRTLTLPCSQNPELLVFRQSQFIGRIQQLTHVNCYCNKTTFQQLIVYGQTGEVLYEVVSPSRQRGQCLILPCCGFDVIDWQIRRPWSGGLYQDSSDVVGSIRHLFSGLGEYTNKTDRYGIQLPEDATQNERALLVMAALFIDYLLFQNF